MAGVNQPMAQLNAQAQAATLPLAQPEAQAGVEAPAVPVFAGAEECTTKIPENIEREIPQVLVWTGKCRTVELFSKINLSSKGP